MAAAEKIDVRTIPPHTLRFQFGENAASDAQHSVGFCEYTLGDALCPGLGIRVRRETAVWTLKARIGPKQSTWRVADCRELRDTHTARHRAREAIKLVKRGIDPREWLQEQELGGPVARHFDRRRDGMAWEEARDTFLTHIEESRQPATYADYRRTLHSGDFNGLTSRLLKEIAIRDIREIQESIAARGAYTQAHHTLRIIKSAFSWLAQKSDSGIESSVARDIKPIDVGRKALLAPRRGRKGIVPSPDQLGTLAWTLAASEGASGAKLAAALVMFTAQRILTVSSARKAHFHALETGGGLWIIPGASMKSGREHVVPLGATAWHLAQSAISLSPEGSSWLFPQTKLRRIGDAGGGYLSYKAVRAVMGDAVAPHDVRRGFATHGDDFLGISGADSKLILDHSEGAGGDVTRRHYNLSRKEEAKWLLAEKWEGWLLAQIRAADPKKRGRVPVFLNPKRES
jgi:integrase